MLIFFFPHEVEILTEIHSAINLFGAILQKKHASLAIFFCITDFILLVLISWKKTHFDALY